MSILEKAKPENYFRCSDGSVLGSVYELENKLCAMSSEAFHHHVNSLRNDFHNWIKDVFQDYELANELLSAKTPAQAAAIVRKHLRKELLAKEEIENAIKTASTAKTKPTKAAVKVKPAKAVPKKRQRKPTKRKKKKAAATAKPENKGNRKLNKITGNNKHHKRRKSSSTTFLRPKSSNSTWPIRQSRIGKRLIKKRNSKRGKSAHKRIRKQVNRWLNWLKIIPEL